MEDKYVRNGQGENSNLFPGLDADTTSALMASEKDWNSDFKGNGVQKIGVAIDFTSKLPIFTSYVTSYITNIVTTYLSQATADMLSIDASQIITNAGKMMPTFVKDSGEIMGELLKNVEDIIEEIDKNNKLDVVSNLNNKVNEQISQLTNKISENMGSIQNIIEDVGKYAYMGPAWIKNKIDLSTKRIIESSFKEIGKTRDNTKKNIQDQIDKISENMAQKMAAEENEKIKKMTKEKFDEANKKKAEAMTKAKTAITNAKLKIMALIGG